GPIRVDGPKDDIKSPYQYDVTREREQIANNANSKEPFRRDNIRGGQHSVVADNQLTANIEPKDPGGIREQVKEAGEPGSIMLCGLFSHTHSPNSGDGPIDGPPGRTIRLGFLSISCVPRPPNLGLQVQ